ncbi:MULTISPECIES: PucR family transcriptional regulator [Metabacillus]|uniref:PucR family transcriptional regulator ligand-binding domain-containing protein n=1 Tax=Metabacillus rhizolycopersici TaxID=2875709 RepID=A0ABS7UQZ2_9BACI|nr:MULTISPECIES: PucR family transcriptional regulator [Metabacillus]MBZ5750703.1 PucR family transcriptional regulator ligand-binding domain-containing protein [Metabacillus rhizolycopersici]MCM3650381.1 PucR family transcriptional regulator ligand-binding domain-containing protein [Metabacillus litoralis]
MKKVEDLFIVDVLQEAKIIAGHAGLTREVESIEISETPDVSHFLAENSLLLTTGYAFKDDPRTLCNLISQINERSCAGIAIKLKRFIDKIPQEVIDLANSLNFPIIQIPASLTLGMVAHQLLSFLWDNKIEELYYAIHVHKKFTNMMIKGYSLHSLIENLGSLLKCPVLLLDPIGDITSFSHHFRTETMKMAMENVAEHLKSDIGNYHKKSELTLDIQNSHYSSISIKMFEVKTMYQYPYLLVIFSPEKLAYPSSQIAIEQASTIISFTLLKNEAIKENSRLLQNNFFSSLVDGNIATKQEMILRGKQHGLIDNLKYVCIVCKIDNDEQEDLQKSTDFMKSLYDYLYKFFKKSFLKIDTKNIVFMKDAYFVILMQLPTNIDDPIKSIIEERLKEFQNEACSHLKISLSFGVGNVFNDITYIPITYEEAVNAWKQGETLFQNKFINFYETKQLKELMRLIPEKDLRKFYENTLRSLAYPKSRDDEDLVNTLFVYLDNNCEIAITARKLYVHRNTVKYRIAKCEDILNYSVHDSQNTLHLRIALLLRSTFT